MKQIKNFVIGFVSTIGLAFITMTDLGIVLAVVYGIYKYFFRPLWKVSHLPFFILLVIAILGGLYQVWYEERKE